MSENRSSYLSGRARGAVFGLAAGLLLLLSGDRASTAVVTGIDPLDILKVLSRPNVFIVLSSAGTMGDTPNSTSASRITLGGDHPSSKLRIAKDTIRTFVQNNQTAANFQLGIYEQPAGSLFIDTAPGRLPAVAGVPAHRFIYTSTDVNATGISVNVGLASLLAPGNVVRDVATDNVTDAAGTALFRLWAGRFFNGETIEVGPTGLFCSSAAGAPTNPATVRLVRRDNACGSGSSTEAVFTFYGVAGDWGNPSGSCDGHLLKMTLRPCNDIDQVTDIAPFLDPQLKVDLATPELRPIGYPSPDILVNPPVTTFGILNGGFQPIAETLIDLKTDFASLYSATISLISPAAARPRSVALLVVDGDDDCSASGTPGGVADENALRAAHKAKVLHDRIAALDPSSSVSTFVVALGGAVSRTRASWIGYGGSGLVLPTTGIDSDPATRWTAPPTPADLATCPDCQSAYGATDSTSLYAAIQDVVAQAVNFGQFSASPQVVSTVFELIVDPDGGGPLRASAFDPTTRYSQRVNILFQSTFDLPIWRGRLFAFRNDGTFLPVAVGVNDGCLNSGGTGTPIWEPGCTLFEKVIKRMRTTSGAGGLDKFTFAQLHGGVSSGSIDGSAAAIRRRVFTTNRNGIWTRNTSGDSDANLEFDASSSQGSNVISLWPPTQSGLNTNPAVIGTACAADGVDPADPATAGCLDTALGLAGLTFAQYQSVFGACDEQPTPDAGFGNLTTGDPYGCTNPGLPFMTAAALKEARQILLAYVAGAALARGSDGRPHRDATTGQLLFQSRDWLLGDTQNAAPVIVTPPLRFEPSKHISEFTLYRDGLRDASGEGINRINSGYGLRNPDFDNANPQADPVLKPVMTVAYLGTNDRLHAFRGGPQCPLTTLPNGSPGSPGCTPPSPEGGSEELWSFIPYDLLGKQKELIQNFGQTRNPHTYGIASSVRGASVFVPSTSGFTINGAPFTGRWRTLLFFGRGPGGKHVTSIDVTAPGAFTTGALATNPPWVLWNRGNPDTNEGTACTVGTPNNSAADCTLYNDVGQTWSVPAIGNVDTTTVSGGTCSPSPEWRLWMGSGYGETVGNGTTHFEGKRFYEMDALTGNVCRTGPFTGASFITADSFASPIANNAFVASPAGFNSRAQDPPGLTIHNSPDRVSRVYIGDLRGRMWVWNVASGAAGVLSNAGATQPIAAAAALLKVNDQPRVFFETGDDNRVPESVAPFKMFGITDTTVDPGAIASTQVFSLNFTNPPPSFRPFRGTTQPTTAFNAAGIGRVFFAGTRFNPPGDVIACAGTFDTILFAVSANSGAAVYDYTGDGVADISTIIAGTKTTGIAVVGGQLFVGDSGALANAPTPTPDPSPTPTPKPPKPAFVTQRNFKVNSAVCRQP